MTKDDSNKLHLLYGLLNAILLSFKNLLIFLTILLEMHVIKIHSGECKMLVIYTQSIYWIFVLVNKQIKWILTLFHMSINKLDS